MDVVLAKKLTDGSAIFTSPLLKRPASLLSPVLVDPALRPKWVDKDTEKTGYGYAAAYNKRIVKAIVVDGVPQVETISVTAACSANGNITFTVTAANMAGSPVSVTVAVTTTDDTAAKVAIKVRAALAANTTIANFFVISGTNADIILTVRALKAVTNDSTLAMSTNVASTGVTFSASANTTAGVAGNGTISTAIVTDGQICADIIQAVAVSSKNVIIACWDETNPTTAAGTIQIVPKSNFTTAPTTKITFAAGVYATRYGTHAYYDALGRDIVLIAEYGKKDAPGNASKVYLSVDGGDNFSTIYDFGNKQGLHPHACCFDPWRNRIWVSAGDDDPVIMYSDKMGETGSWITVSTAYKPTSITCFPKYAAFGGDEFPAGVFRWNYAMEEKIKINAGRLADFSQLDYSSCIDKIFPIDAALSALNTFAVPPVARIDDYTCYLGFVAAGATGNYRKTGIMATGDGGESWHIVFVDLVNSSGLAAGLVGLCGDGKILAHYNSQRGSKNLQFVPINWA
jgi:hypothetical protein